MCIDAPESTKNSPSSDFVEVGAGIIYASVGRVECGLVPCFEHASLRAHCSCFKVFVLGSFSAILAHTDCVLEVHTFE